MLIALFFKASRSRPVSGHRQVRESVENERSAFALRAHMSLREGGYIKSIIRGFVRYGN
jgi:hypothetical protein